tara:strand:- start:24221 stop:25168 length:948 start_codon:yes stop_codon:yes gene_type:complete
MFAKARAEKWLRYGSMLSTGFPQGVAVLMSKKSVFKNVALVGVGLIGGSIGLALQKRKLADVIVGIDPSEKNLDTALNRKAITQGTTDLQAGIQGACLAIISAPVQKIPFLISAVADASRGNCLITDTGSTKRGILARVNAETRFIGSHPMAGAAQHGPKTANADLFEDRAIILTPPTHAETADIRALEQFWTRLGAHTVEMSAVDHDRVVSSVSHLPHLAAVALAAATPPMNLPHVASGWLDTTRIAASGESLWVDILCDNRDHVLKSAERFGKVWTQLCGALERNDRTALRRVLREAKNRRDLADPAENERNL